MESGKEVKYIGRVAKIEKVNGNETLTYFHTDHLGSTRAVTDSAGNQSSGTDIGSDDRNDKYWKDSRNPWTTS